MSKNYDNWERLVTAVIRRQRDWQIALADSRDTSSIGSSLSTLEFSLSSNSQFDHQDHSLPPEKQEFVWRTLGLRYFVDERSGKNCFLLGVTYLKIKAFGVDKFSKKFHMESRFREVAEIIYHRMIHIKGAIPIKLLSMDSSYSAYLVFGSIDNQSRPDKVYSSIILSGQPRDSSRKQNQLIYFEQSQEREDGWMEIHLGDFNVDRDNGEIQVKLVDIDVSWRSGLVIEGIEFRPTN